MTGWAVKRRFWPRGYVCGGVDAVYVATAVLLGVPPVIWDVEQRERAVSVVQAQAPDAPGVKGTR